MKSILVGNGLNIQFGGNAYRSDFIIKRVKNNIRLKKYDLALFEATISTEEQLGILNSFVSVANNILEGKYNDIDFNCDERLSVEDFIARYEKYRPVTELHHIALEDWFILLHVLLKTPELKDLNTEHIVKQGFERMFLDGIYNDGLLQDNYKKMNKRVKRYFKEFDNIFTLNYDNNLEKLTGSNVYHLHGDYSVLHDSEDPNTIEGFIRIKSGSNIKIPAGFEHCFCNALLDYDGELKKRNADLNHNLNKESELFEYRYNHDSAWRNDLEKAKFTKDANTKNAYEWAMTKINNPHLKARTDYHFDLLENLSGELYILGMSPSNDNHIIKLIKNNSKITKVTFYSFKNEEESIKQLGFAFEDVEQLWKSLDASKPKYHSNYAYPSNMKQFIDIFSALGDDRIDEAHIKDEANAIPLFEAKQLCKRVCEEVLANSKKTNVTEEDLKRDFGGIRKIALQEGVSPPTLFMFMNMFWNEIIANNAN